TPAPLDGPGGREALVQWRRIQADPQWPVRLTEAVRVEAELPLVHEAAGELVVGTVDLLLELPGRRMQVIDHKPTLFAAEVETATDAELIAFACARGYDVQLRRYCAAVQALVPDATVTAEIYFSSLSRFVRLR